MSDLSPEQIGDINAAIDLLCKARDLILDIRATRDRADRKSTRSIDMATAANLAEDAAGILSGLIET